MAAKQTSLVTAWLRRYRKPQQREDPKDCATSKGYLQRAHVEQLLSMVPTGVVDKWKQTLFMPRQASSLPWKLTSLAAPPCAPTRAGIAPCPAYQGNDGRGRPPRARVVYYCQHSVLQPDGVCVHQKHVQVVLEQLMSQDHAQMPQLSKGSKDQCSPMGWARLGCRGWGWLIVPQLSFVSLASLERQLYHMLSWVSAPYPSQLGDAAVEGQGQAAQVGLC